MKSEERDREGQREEEGRGRERETGDDLFEDFVFFTITRERIMQNLVLEI